MQTIIMRPQHSKDPAMLKYFEYLMGERYDTINVYIQMTLSSTLDPFLWAACT